jgi:hypothetical protein
MTVTPPAVLFDLVLVPMDPLYPCARALDRRGSSIEYRLAPMRFFPLALVSLATLGACVQQSEPRASDAPRAAPESGYLPPPPPAAPPPTATDTPAPAATEAAPSTPTAQTSSAASAQRPSASVTVGKASVSGQLANPDLAVAALRSDFERCYAAELAREPMAAGTVLLALELGKDGAIARANATPSGNVPDKVQSCIRERAERLKLSAPKGGSAIVSFTVTLAAAPVLATTAESSPELEEIAISPPGFEHGDKVANFARKHARDCYRDALRIHARAEGRMSVALWLDDKGVVTKVEASKTGTLPDSVTACIQKRTRPAKFPAPKISPTVVTVPVRLALKPAK